MKVKPTNLEHNGQVILEVAEGPFLGLQYYYTHMKMADKENDDGSMNMSFEYFLHQGEIPKGKKSDFERFIGDALLEILEEQIKKEEVVFKGGTDENVISVTD